MSEKRKRRRWTASDKLRVVLAGLGVAEVRRLKLLEEENKMLKALVADLSLDKQILQDVFSKML